MSDAVFKKVLIDDFIVAHVLPWVRGLSIDTVLFAETLRYSKKENKKKSIITQKKKK